jgi:hypothetical protein
MPLLDVRPSLTADHFDDRVGLDAVFASQRGFGDAACGEAGADVPDIIGRKFPHASAMNLSPPRSDGEPLAFRRLGHIFGLIPEMQMIGTYARPIVALVKNVLTGGDRPIGQFPCDPMSALAGDDPVSVDILQAKPKPTITSRIYSIPELFKGTTLTPDGLAVRPTEALWIGTTWREFGLAFNACSWRSPLCRANTPAATEAASVVLDVTRPHPEGVATVGACQGNLARHLDATKPTILNAHQGNLLLSRPRPARTGAGVSRVHYTTEVPLWFYI